MSEHPPKIRTVHLSAESFHNALRFSHHAMATIFEIFIIHDDAHYAQQAAYESFRELDRLERELSRFIENSDISRINNLAANQTIRVGLDTFECLKQCSNFYNITNGAFDVTVGHLVSSWMNPNTALGMPSEAQKFTQSRDSHLLQLDETNVEVTLLSDSISIDLGGFGKGYAIDQMARLLREWEVETVLIHGGTSSVLALAPPPAEQGWPLTVSSPGEEMKRLSHLYLQNRALSASGLQKGQHIINPRTGESVEHTRAAWASCPTAAASDALSTAFMVMAPDEIKQFCQDNPNIGALVILKEGGGRKEKDRIWRFGDWQ